MPKKKNPEVTIDIKKGTLYGTLSMNGDLTQASKTPAKSNPKTIETEKRRSPVPKDKTPKKSSKKKDEENVPATSWMNANFDYSGAQAPAQTPNQDQFIITQNPTPPQNQAPQNPQPAPQAPAPTPQPQPAAQNAAGGQGNPPANTGGGQGGGGTPQPPQGGAGGNQSGNGNGGQPPQTQPSVRGTPVTANVTQRPIKLKFESLIIPSFVGLALGFILSATIGVLVAFFLPGTDLFRNIVLGLLAFVILFGFGIRNVPVVHTAVPLVLGMRIPWIVFGEGYQWALPWPLMDFNITGVMTKRQSVPPPVGGRPFLVETVKFIPEKDESGNPTGKTTMEFVVAESRVIITGKVVNPYQYIQAGGKVGVTNAEEESAPEKNVVSATTSEIREIAGSGTINDIEFNAQKGDIASLIRDDVNKTSIPEWGFGVETLRITSYLADASTREARSGVTREQAERESERIQRQHFDRQIKDAMVAFPGINFEQAKNYITMITDKLPSRHLIISGSEAGNERAAAIINDGFANQNSGQQGQ